ncbi:hypothetical protein ACFVWG_12730 [Kribbella sp. NPDC058245]|uniref:hypothetical protein n=1 Tax=Kribbella sp. NPDC058245 TaxID=3346399 RepID=UPI0036E6E81C
MNTVIENQMPQGRKRSIPQGTYLAENVKAFGAQSRTESVASRLRPIEDTVVMPEVMNEPAVVNTVGVQPEGFGKSVSWRGEDDLAVVAFINPADDLGVAIQGVRDQDTIQMISATGSASFDEETKNAGIPSLITVVGEAAGLTAAAFGAAVAVPFIKVGETYAKEMFKEKQVKTKVRDAYGRDPKSRDLARQEGGVLVCFPAATGIWTSGGDKDAWIKEGQTAETGERVDANRPAHVVDAYFLRKGDQQPHASAGDGDLFLSAWDYKFGDNLGTYEVHFLMKRGVPQHPDPVERRDEQPGRADHRAPGNRRHP